MLKEIVLGTFCFLKETTKTHETAHNDCGGCSNSTFLAGGENGPDYARVLRDKTSLTTGSRAEYVSWNLSVLCTGLYYSGK
jgi:hypothetical protein